MIHLQEAIEKFEINRKFGNGKVENRKLIEKISFSNVLVVVIRTNIKKPDPEIFLKKCILSNLKHFLKVSEVKCNDFETSKYVQNTTYI